MDQFYSDILMQPEYLLHLAHYYSHDGYENLNTLPQAENLIFTGMGASFHAISALIPMLHTHCVPAIAMESIDLINYSLDCLVNESQIVFVSQSGASGEVLPVTQLARKLIAVTNEEESLLAKKAQRVLPIKAGQNESGVASRTYLNTLATLWLLNRRWTGLWDNSETDQINDLAVEIKTIINNADEIIDQWIKKFEDISTLIFMGHGSQAATAKEASMMMAEWAKRPTLNYGIGAFRHGPIEIVDQECGLVIFTSPGISNQSSTNLANELNSYGAKVLIVENGVTRNVENTNLNIPLVDEFLSPILNIIPAQLFTWAMARRTHVQTSFRYIKKVTTKI